MEDCINFVNFIRPELADLLVQQLNDYGIVDGPREFPIEEQADDIDEIPIHNFAMENYCGKDAQLIEKYGTVDGASRSKLIKGTEKLTEKQTSL